MMLRGHTYKTFKAQARSLDCRNACLADVRCQSYNVVMFENLCELNNRSKEARPGDFIENESRYHVCIVSERVPLASIPELPADSCKEIKASEQDQAISGKYWLDPMRSGNSILAFCDMETETADYCIKHQCAEHATCVNGHFRYTCECNSSGWTGSLCKTDIDECTKGFHSCHSDASCNNTAGSYVCTCNSGYLGDGFNCIPEECQNYQSLTSETRNTKYTAPSSQDQKCDKSLGPGWFRFQGAAGTKMPTECVSWHSCGTLRPGWLKGGHPLMEDGKVSRQVNFRSSGNCAFKTTTIQVRNCGSFFVYYLHNAPSGGCHRYCSTG